MPTPFKFGPEFLVNNLTADTQDDSQVTGLANGRFLVTWKDHSHAGGDPDIGIAARMFGADGAPLGNQFLVNTTVAGSQVAPTVASLDNGGFVLAWTDIGATPHAVEAQIYDGSGAKQGTEFIIGSSSSIFNPSLETLADGRFVASWEDWTSPGTIRARIYNPDGTTSVSEFTVNTATGHEIDSDIAALPDGRFVITWSDQVYHFVTETVSSSDIRAQVFNADGTKSGSEILVNTTTTGLQQSPDITALHDGHFVVTWTDDSATSADTSQTAIIGQVFNSDGSTSGGEFLVNTSTNSYQIVPSITTLADGRFVASWSDRSGTLGDASAYAVHAQVFNIDGSKSGFEFRVNTTTANSQSDQSISALADGRFVLSWTDSSVTGGDTSGPAIRAQIFDPRVAPVHLNGSFLDDDFVGTGFGDDMSGFVGDDSITGRGGDDVLNGELGNDTLMGNHGNDKLNGGGGDDVLRGGLGADQISGGGGADQISGGFGADYMAGGGGNDVFMVDIGSDIVIEKAHQGVDEVRSGKISLTLADYANVENLGLTGKANLNLTGSSGKNVLNGNNGKNTLNGLGGNDELHGRVGADHLNGGGGNDQIYGEGGNDTLTGGGGNDALIGGLGQDSLTGAAGADTFWFTSITESGASASTRDTITDFSQAQGDKIDLSLIDAAPALGDQAFTFIGTAAFSGTAGELRYKALGGSNTLVQMDVDGDGTADSSILLTGTIALSAGDFIL